MTPGPTSRRPRSARCTTRRYGSRRAYSSRMAGVSSVDPSSTTTQAAGCTDCAATLSSVRRRYWASFRQGEMST